MTIGMNSHGELCQIAKLGGVPVNAVALLGYVENAHEQVKVISKYIAGRLLEDAKKKDKGGMRAELSAENARVS